MKKNKKKGGLPSHQPPLSNTLDWDPQWLLPHHHENPTRGFLFHQLEINNTLGLFSLSPPSFVPSGSLSLLIYYYSSFPLPSSPDRSSVRYVSRQHRVIGASMRPDEGLSPFPQQGGSNIGVLWTIIRHQQERWLTNCSFLMYTSRKLINHSITTSRAS